MKMKKAYIAMMAAAIPAMGMAQSAIDAGLASQPDFKGTARFMSMGGAFTALGGDLSTLNQNPAGIGIYRSSEIGVTLDINMQSTATTKLGTDFPNTASQTKVYCNNFGYVGSTRLDGAMRTFNWGVTFNRAASFDRVYRGYFPTIGTSLSNYVAGFTNGVSAIDMYTTDYNKYNPYLDTDIDWMSILAYNTFMINATGNATPSGNTYTGLYKGNTYADAVYDVREKGYVDEYNISFGGNVEDVVYWGLSIGITDLNYKRWAYYSESLANANVPDLTAGDENTIDYPITNGRYVYDLDNYKYINGSGWNLKAGVIIKPVNELRIGLAVHTPTFYKLSQNYNAVNSFTVAPTTIYNPSDPASGMDTGEATSDSDETDVAYFDWQFNAPWKLMVGVAGVIGNKAIVSADYEFAGYNSMNIKIPYGYNSWGGYDYISDEATNSDISAYYKNQSTLRLGLEYRATPQLSLRAGYNVRMSNAKQEAYDGALQIMTSGTDPSFSFDKTTQNISCGIGYKYQSWYIDAAYVYTARESKYSAFTNYGGVQAPSAKIDDHNSSIVLSTGFRF